MYNMDIKLFGMSFRLEILLLIVIIYLIMFGHICCSCYRGNGSLLEALTNAPVGGENRRTRDYTFQKGLNTFPTQEGFTGANTNYGQSAPYSLVNSKPTNTSSWGASNLTYQKGKPVDKSVQNILNRQPQPIPLPEGELDIFATTPFKPECCPSSYSNSMGCACITMPQYNYLIGRGGNNVPYSLY